MIGNRTEVGNDESDDTEVDDERDDVREWMGLHPPRFSFLRRMSEVAEEPSFSKAVVMALTTVGE